MIEGWVVFEYRYQKLYCFPRLLSFAFFDAQDIFVWQRFPSLRVALFLCEHFASRTVFKLDLNVERLAGLNHS